MKFSRKKFPKDAIQTLRRVPVGLWQSFHLLLTPVYVYLQLNQKFVAVKGPLQYFSPAELEKLKAYENFYLPDFVDLIEPFQRAGRAVRDLFSVKQKRAIQTNTENQVIVLPAPQHELDDAVLRQIGPLWSEGARVEPFFLCFLADEICGPISGERMSQAVERDVDAFELALLRSSAAVFLALHIGYSEVSLLTRFRDRLLEESMNGTQPKDLSSELSQLSQLVWDSIPDTAVREISIESIQSILNASGRGGRSSKKLLSRLNRVQAELIRPDTPVASLFGEKGICDE